VGLITDKSIDIEGMLEVFFEGVASLFPKIDRLSFLFSSTNPSYNGETTFCLL